MSNDDIPVPSAARGVVAINVNGLLAQRAGDFFFQHWKSEAVSNGSAEDSWLQKGVSSVFLRRNCSDEPIGVPHVRLGPYSLERREDASD